MQTPASKRLVSTNCQLRRSEWVDPANLDGTLTNDHQACLGEDAGTPVRATLQGEGGKKKKKSTNKTYGRIFQALRHQASEREVFAYFAAAKRELSI